MPKKRALTDFPFVCEFLQNMAGDGAVIVVKLCQKKGRGIADEELAKKMRVKVTEVRTVLNRLHYRGVACYQKAKNKKTGWYSYTWGIKKGRIIELLLAEQEEQIEKLQEQEKFESCYSFFSCKKNCGNLPFEVAAEYQFKCPDCGATMEAVDNEKRLSAVRKRIENVQEKMEELRNIK